MTMGEKILTMRRSRGWSQEELADRVGVTRQAVSRWESGSAKPDSDKIITICTLFGVSADYLLGLTAEKTKSEAPREPAPEPKIIYVPQQVSGPAIGAKTAGWLLIGVSSLLIVAYFVFRDVTRDRMDWLFWVGVGGVFAGVCLAPGAKFCAKKTYRKRLGWAMLGLSVLPVLVFVGYFGLLHGDWEMEIVYPSVTVFLPGLILLRDWKSDGFW